MEKSQQQQQVYFQQIADEFDGHYLEQKRKPISERVIDRIFRQGMVQRYDYLTRKLNWNGQTILDVGCGPGRYMVEFVRGGASRVTGLDFASSMIDIARHNLNEQGMLEKAELITGNFLTTSFLGKFDSVVAIGYFDYILGAQALDEHFGRMWDLAAKRVVASFPNRWSFKTLPRWIWLSMRKCPVQFVTHGGIDAMLQRLGVQKYQTVRMSGTILVIAERT